MLFIQSQRSWIESHTRAKPPTELPRYVQLSSAEIAISASNGSRKIVLF